MLRVIDNTLMALEQDLPSKEDLHNFCRLLFTIGVDLIELPVRVYKRMEYLPCEGKFLLNIEFAEERKEYPGIFRYVCRQGPKVDQIMYEIQMNDTREIVKLREFSNLKLLRIVGLDDLLCHSYEKIMKELRHNLAHAMINFNPENTFGCAGALALQWLMDGGIEVTTSFAGCKNNAATEEVLMALRLALRHKPNRDLTVLPELTRIYERFMKRSVGNKKPIIGKNIFKVEAGIHADGLYKNPVTYEAYEPGCVGGRSELVIGKHSGTKAIKLKLQELNLPVPKDEEVELLLKSIKVTCTKDRKSLSEEEFVCLVMGVSAGER